MATNNTVYTQVSTLNKGLEAFASYLPILSAASTLFEPNAGVGTAIEVPLVTGGNGSTFNGNYTPSGSSITKVTVPLVHKFVSFAINIKESSELAAAQLENLYSANLKSFAKVLAAEAMLPITGYSTSASAANFGYDTVKDIASKLNQNDVVEDRYLLVDTTLASGLYVSSSMNTAVTVQNYDFVGYNKVSTGVMPSPVKAIGLSKSCLAVGYAYPVDPLAGSTSLIDEVNLVEPQTGIPIRFKVFGSPLNGEIIGVFETRIGAARGLDKAVIVK